ncbi:YciI family protein [Actinoplanes awajinensis]|uniref:YCII-related domain-containing protein n=1 Tax=Actinoplanes awajinensis subsp. mycoplanecinus TaxID=135947 RepID=A0A0X3VAQ9_9ACTN|nr:hypothetical protein [Actinoplanes awajinensis]KUL41830.1 hypothetical protein ADL15_02980 [Actinoplanes awajinensis subsp. mycoplanecinus]
MARFVVLYRAPHEVAARFVTATPEEAVIGVQQWTDWFTRLGPALVDPGRPLGHTTTVSRTGVADAPTEIVGMTILEAASMDEAVALVGDHHHLQWSDQCTITILEEMGIPEVEAGLVG